MGTIFHVRVDGSDADCSGTADAPATKQNVPKCAWQTPQKAWDSGALAATGPTTILIHGGTYSAGGRDCPRGAKSPLKTVLCADADGNASSTKSFDPGVEVRAADGETVVLDGGGTINTGIAVWNVSHVAVSRLRFRNFTAGSTSSWPMGGAAIDVATSSGKERADFLTFEGLDVRGNPACRATGDSAAVTLGWSSGVHHVILRSSYVESDCPYGLALGSSSSVAPISSSLIEGNTVRKTRPIRMLLLRSRHADDVTVRNNYFAAVDGNSGDEGLQIRDNRRWSVTGNVLEHVSGYVIDVFDEGGDGDNVEEHVVENNTLIGASKTSGICFYTLGRGGCDGCSIANNIMEECHTGIRLEGDGSGVGSADGRVANTTVSHTLFHDVTIPIADNGTGGYSIDVGHDRTGDPNFTDDQSQKPKPFFIPRPPSPAIDSGDDSRCAWQPSDGRCDMGAFEAGEAN